MIIFYSPEILDTLTLPESDSAHAIRVLRLKEGDEIAVTDGRGSFIHCRITLAHPKRTGIEVINIDPKQSFWNGPLTIAVAPTKNMDRMEWMTEKLTEIGIDRITPLLCRHSERKEIKTERLQKIAVSAMKQSLKGVLPQIDEMTPILKFITEDTTPQKFIAYCSDDFPRKNLTELYKPEMGATLLIGPEGDFTSEEIAKAIECGFVPVSLGDARLRTETAAIVGINTFHIIQQLKK